MLPLILIGLGVLLVLGMLIWQIVRSAQTTGSVTTDPNIPFPEVERVSLADSKAAFDGGEAVFLDVRDPDSYAASHIPGAINIPVSQLESRAAELDPNEWIITYCT